MSLAQLRQLTDKLENTETFFEAFLRQAPFVMWAKDYSSGEGKMVFISDKYSRIFDVYDVEYVGKTDYDIWPDYIAREFEAQDRIVLSTERTHAFEDLGVSATEEKWETCKTIKFPIRDTGGHVMAVGGICWPDNGRG